MNGFDCYNGGYSLAGMNGYDCYNGMYSLAGMNGYDCYNGGYSLAGMNGFDCNTGQVLTIDTISARNSHSRTLHFSLYKHKIRVRLSFEVVLNSI